MSFSVKPVLTGEKTVLRPFTEADAEVMAEIIRDPEVVLYEWGARARGCTFRALLGPRSCGRVSGGRRSCGTGDGGTG